MDDNRINYAIATIGLSTDGTWFVTYLGDVPEQGGIEFKTGQVYFEDLKDAVSFLKDRIMPHETMYKSLVEGKKK